MQRLGPLQFLNDGLENQIIDVRSPAEFSKGHIPGAVNIPIFNNLERAKVGTVYKQQSRDDAISLGLEIVGPKMKSFTESAKKTALNGMLNVYCWRGGMRSDKMAWLFELVGIQTNVLEGGYKAYRYYLHNFLSKIENLIVVQGPTGSGKTKILHALREKGEQVLDLEGLAKHKGSAFGGLGEKEQPTTQQFQNNIFAELHSFDLSRPIWVESESITIGRVYLPEKLWQKMNDATVLAIDVPREFRIKHIIEQYGLFTQDELISKISRLAQNMGSANVKQAISYVEEGDLHGAVGLLLQYYDKYYAHSASKYKLNKPLSVKLGSSSTEENAQIIINQTSELKT
jgi:tRNA 2-selenouridine synthase